MKNIFKDYINWFIENGLNEDIGAGDHTSNACIPKHQYQVQNLL